MRYKFAEVLEKIMDLDENVYFLTGDLGYKIFDRIMDKYPTRALTVGASEQMMLSIAVGLADSGKIPFVYSITPFLLYRPFEVIRNYIDHEKCNVKLIGCGRNSDYAHDGFTHYAGDDRAIMDNFTNITKIWPENLLELEEALTSTYKSSDPCYINITR